MGRTVNKRFESILVANRGEIACRVLRTAAGLGYRTVAVYSEVDAEAPHVALADQAILIGPAQAAQSYLDIERIIDAAARTGAEAIHPGYGFLSENAAFAQACNEAGLVFIGPSPEIIELMGNKAEAKRRMIEAGVPCVPGYQGLAQDDAALSKAAAGIGYPVMVKAAAGGGGRGMRLVTQQDDFTNALRLARSEAENAFGSGQLILEKAIIRPRHVEFQIFADEHGNAVHMGERDCSIQRRHQKVLEESPCPVMTPQLRDQMGAAAVAAANSIGYVGAGTVEFLLDENREFYFLEMNTRLQVEHPVTEMVTGLDLVELQIAVARGEPLAVSQDEIVLQGHAIEVRLYAEDPGQGFMPSSGLVELWHPPQGAAIRVDGGVATGLEISPFYDAMMAKIIAHGSSRESARLRLIKALEDTAVFGPCSNRDFLIGILQHKSFVDGTATTAFIEESSHSEQQNRALNTFHRAATAAVLDYRAAAARSLASSVQASRRLVNWSSSGFLESHYSFDTGENESRMTVAANPGHYRVNAGDSTCVIDVLHDDGVSAEVSIDGASHRVIYCAPSPGVTWLAIDGLTERFSNRLSTHEKEDETATGGRVLAPMHGQLLEVAVNPGDRVEKGQRLLVLEAMKMQHEILAGVSGLVKAVNARSGEQVALNELIIEIESGETG